MNFTRESLYELVWSKPISSIAKEYDINREILRNFHNNICSISEIIPKEIPVYLEYIYIPIETFLGYQDN